MVKLEILFMHAWLSADIGLFLRIGASRLSLRLRPFDGGKLDSFCIDIHKSEPKLPFCVTRTSNRNTPQFLDKLFTKNARFFYGAKTRFLV